jgi:6-pyruvoyltetrahydropterin/6-carboxytetrahydropterin synthase
MFLIRKEYKFEAAHQLPEHDGKCSRPHGHSYRVEVFLEAAGVVLAGPKTGMVMDFADLDRIVEPLIDHLDHSDINKTWALLLERHQLTGFMPTTAESLASGLYYLLIPFMPNDMAISKVRVWETAKAYAEFSL